MRSLLALAVFMTACGQMGPLVLPDKSPKPAPQQQPAPPPPSAPDDVERQKKQTVGPTP